MKTALGNSHLSELAGNGKPRPRSEFGEQAISLKIKDSTNHAVKTIANL